MVLHRRQAQFERARWRMGLLVLSWVVQIVFLSALIGIFAYRLVETSRAFAQESDQGNPPTVELVWECVNVGLCLISLILVITEISTWARETMTPSLMVWTHILKFTGAAAVLAVDIVAYWNDNRDMFAVIGLGIDAALVASVAISGVYVVIIHRRVARYDDGHHPANVKSFGFSLPELEFGDNEGGAESWWRRASSGSFSGRNMDVDAYVAAPRSLGTRRPSYDHRRDTQFEEYVMVNRTSGSLRENIHRAVGTEFGWSNDSPDLGGALERSSSFVGSGTVQSAKGLRLNEAGRTKSWTTERVLGSVPEGPDEEDHDSQESQGSRAGSGDGVAAADSGSRNSGGDQQALLGHNRRWSRADEILNAGDDHRQASRPGSWDSPKTGLVLSPWILQGPS